MDRYLGGEEIAHDTLIDDLEKAVARAHASTRSSRSCSVTGVGCAELLDLAVDGFPSPLEHPSPEVFTPAGRPRRADQRATRAARWSPRSSRRPATRTSAGSAWSGSSPARSRPTRRCTCRVTSRRSSADVEPATRTTTRTRRIGALSVPVRAARSVPADAVVAGDLVRDRQAEPRRDRRHPVRDERARWCCEPWSMPEPLLPVAIVAQEQGRRGQAVPGARPARRRGPDAARREQPRDPPARAVGMGEAHADVLLDRLARPLRRRTSRPSRSWCRCARRSAARARGTAGTSSSPAATASTPSATSRSSRCPRAAGSSSSTRWSAAPCRGSSSPASRRACAPRWSGASRRATRWSTSGSP